MESILLTNLYNEYINEIGKFYKDNYEFMPFYDDLSKKNTEACGKGLGCLKAFASDMEINSYEEFINSYPFVVYRNEFITSLIIEPAVSKDDLVIYNRIIDTISRKVFDKYNN